MANRFVIVSAARTGSTVLRHMLNNHPNMCCHGELLTRDANAAISRHAGYGGKKSNILDFSVEQLKADPARYIREFVLNPGNFKAVGIKIIYQDLLGTHARGVLDWIRDNKDIKIIHLRRQNRLRRLISHRLAIQSGVFLVHIGGNTPIYDKIKLGLEECIVDFQEIIRLELMVDGIFSEHSVKSVTYEHIMNSFSDEIDGVLDFIEVPKVPLTSTLVKLGAKNLNDVVDDYAELRRSAAGTPYESYFD
ncbi:sulfotransferase [Azospirillum doebereinerae]